MHSAVPSAMIERLDFRKDDPEGYNFLEEDLLPADFVANDNRELSKLQRVLFSTQGIPFTVILNAPFFQVVDPNGNPQNIVFLE